MRETGATNDQLAAAAWRMWQLPNNDDASRESFEIERHEEIAEMRRWAAALVPSEEAIVRRADLAAVVEFIEARWDYRAGAADDASAEDRLALADLAITTSLRSRLAAVLGDEA